jgi:hypothetical protein
MHEQKTVIYVAYGNNKVYHSGVLFNWLRLTGLGLTKSIDNIIVYTDRPSYYEGYPFTIRPISPNEIANWSLNGSYHFRIKTKTLEEALTNYQGKVLHIDSDVLIRKPLSEIFKKITNNECVFSINEGPLCERYTKIIESETPDFLKYYSDLNQVRMYCSSIVGVSYSMLPGITLADQLMLNWIPKTTAHTIEQFAISQGLLRQGNKIISLSGWFDDFGSKGRKAHAKKRIDEFLSVTEGLNFDEKSSLAAKWDLNRDFVTWFKQKFFKKF